MKKATMIIAIGIIFACMLPPTSASESTTSKIDITATIVTTREEAFPDFQGSHRTTYLRLWNHNITQHPIGYALLTCNFVGRGGILGSGVWTCNNVYKLPLGMITSSGITHSRYRYTSAITGGTGRYLGKDGVIFSKRIGPNTLKVIMQFPT